MSSIGDMAVSRVGVAHGYDHEKGHVPEPGESYLPMRSWGLSDGGRCLSWSRQGESTVTYEDRMNVGKG